MCTHIKAIEEFVNYFQNQKDDISAIPSTFYRKIIYVTALDTFARAAFGKGGTNHDRYINMLKNLTRWQYMEYVSLPQLYMALGNNKSCNLCKDDLYKEAKKLLENWPHGEILSLEKSLQISVLEALSKKNCEKEYLKKAQYAELFYTYRNNLVHEFREPGQAFEGLSTIKDQPHYHRHQNIPKNATHKGWELVFPVGFFAYLYNEALEGLKNHLKDNDINPYNKFELGSKWI